MKKFDFINDAVLDVLTARDLVRFQDALDVAPDHELFGQSITVDYCTINDIIGRKRIVEIEFSSRVDHSKVYKYTCTTAKDGSYDHSFKQL
jgi:hypothetical protein